MSLKPRVYPIKILLVEDNPGDVRLVKEAINDCGQPVELAITRDGEEAMEFLNSLIGRARDDFPTLILLDLNLPRKNGREVLAEIKNDPILRTIPVIVFTASQAESDILAAYDLHANCYITKPIDLDDFLRTIHTIVGFWLDLVQLP